MNKKDFGSFEDNSQIHVKSEEFLICPKTPKYEVLPHVLLK